MIDNYESWGRYPKQKPASVVKLFWRSEIPDLIGLEGKILPYGLGRSYGDSCLNEGGTIIDASGLNRFISFDRESGIIRCEAGVSLASILDLIVPEGWFLPVTPGTKFVTVAGAIANDVHGKNHHVAGTFGCHVTQFGLLRSDGSHLICSHTENHELFKATIGGLGLTGLITWVEFRVKRCPSPFIAMESIKFDNLDEFFEINKTADKRFDFTVSWVDCTATGSKLGRGIYSGGNFANPREFALPDIKNKKPVIFPFDAPFINYLSVNAFNILFFNKQMAPVEKSVVHYNPFFYPLDAVHHWNKAYGKNGFLQYQFVVPFANDKTAIREILEKVSKSGLSSFLTVLKSFGDFKSPGMLSFPRPGVTMAIDFRFAGDSTLKALEDIDIIVKNYGGVLYPAKDARMSASDFKEFYPQWEAFIEYIDPKFSSGFWRRVTA